MQVHLSVAVAIGAMRKYIGGIDLEVANGTSPGPDKVFRVAAALLYQEQS